MVADLAGRVYLDYAASAPLRLEARARMVELLDVFGNPSSVHAEGQAARIVLDESRRSIADLMGVRAERVVFTSGGTEANNLALRGVMGKAAGKRLLVSAVEHDCVRNTGLALGATEIPVYANGVVQLAWLQDELAKGDVAMVSVMMANNENGGLQPVTEIAAMCRAAGAVFHTDAVQTVGHMPVNVDGIGADLLSFAAHKFGGPKGAGVLIVKPEVDMNAAVTGGSQERNRRAGTENVLGVGGMVAAMAAAFDKMAVERAAAARLQALMVSGLKNLGLTVVGETAERVEHVVQVLTPGKRGEDVVIGMDMRGVAVSQGSACGSGRVKESHVLKAMGYGREAGEAVRLSWGWGSVESDIEAAVTALAGIVR